MEEMAGDMENEMEPIESTFWMQKLWNIGGGAEL